MNTGHYAAVPTRLALTILLLLAGCGTLPRDIDGTSDRIAAAGRIRVGIDGPVGAEGAAFLTRLEAATGARVERHAGSLEHLVAALEDERLELIVAPVRAEAMLADEVALSPPLDGSAEGDRPVQVRAGVRNGENRWVMTVERVARARP